MTSYYSELEKLLTIELANIEKSTFDFLRRSELMVHASVECYKKLIDKLKNHQFLDSESEIYFFKNINPHAISRIHYYSLIVKFLNHTLSISDSKQRKAYCKKLLKQATLYFTENQYVISYYKSSKYHLDEKYFLRSCSDFPFVLEECHAFLDRETSTGYDLIIARYLAYSQFAEYLQNDILHFDSIIKTPNLGTGSVFLPWTGSKIELIELMYALHAKGSISNGQVPVNELAKFFEVVFKMELGDFYRSFNEIKHRNKQTLFIDNLRKAFVEKASEKDI